MQVIRHLLTIPACIIVLLVMYDSLPYSKELLVFKKKFGHLKKISNIEKCAIIDYSQSSNLWTVFINEQHFDFVSEEQAKEYLVHLGYTEVTATVFPDAIRTFWIHE